MKTNILLQWDDKRGVFKKFILTPALQQKDKNEEQWVASLYIGDLQ